MPARDLTRGRRRRLDQQERVVTLDEPCTFQDTRFVSLVDDDLHNRHSLSLNFEHSGLLHAAHNPKHAHRTRAAGSCSVTTTHCDLSNTRGAVDPAFATPKGPHPTRKRHNGDMLGC